ncbi:MAG: hypothetical protein AB2A00_37970 [Myxococcota bacterium]
MSSSADDVAQVRTSPNDVFPLALAGFCSAALMTGIAFAAREATPQDSLTVAVRTVFATLGMAALGLMLVLRRPSYADARASVTSEGLVIRHAGGQKVIPRSAILYAFLVEEDGRWVVDVQRLTGAVRVILAQREPAERIARELGGMTAPARLRLRIKSTYFMFVGTVATWLLVYCGLIALPWYPVLGTLLAGAMLPAAIWVTKQTVPGLVVVSQENIAVIRPRGVQVFSMSRVREVQAVAENQALVLMKEGGEIPLALVAHHDVDKPPRGVTLTPAQRLREAVSSLTA